MGVRRRRSFGRAAAAAALAALFSAGCRGEAHGPGEIRGRAVPESVTVERDRVRDQAAGAVADRARTAAPADQILFGDLHVHTTFSADAYMMSLPIMQGEGVHPVADACDFARYCSSLDFWSITDHAESLTPKRWRETVDSIRRCDAIAGGGAASDLVSYLGWEWTQIGLTADEHYGHRNVILRDLDDGRIPKRPVAASSFAGKAMRDKLPWSVRFLLPLLDGSHRQRYLDFIEFSRATRATPICPPGVAAKDVTEDCMDFAATPAELFAKLDEWEVESTVIPHGTAWGIYTPPGYAFDKSLAGVQHDDRHQRLIEVFSGHGNSEEYRSWREAVRDDSGTLVCPEATDDYEPCCWRAGEIIRTRCEEPRAAECEKRVEAARHDYLVAGASGRLTVAGADVAEWGACGTCRDCFEPAFELRPGGTVQYAMALSNFADAERVRRFRFGFIASSDNHSARPGTGYKEYGRLAMTEAFGPRSEFWRDQVRPIGEPEPESEPIDPRNNRFQRYQVLDFERGSSFFYTGGLVAVHAAARDRSSIWQALQDRHVYGTSGERILLWFDLLDGEGTAASMGDERVWDRTPRFRVRAVGSLEQKPGCPSFASEGLDAERLSELCGGECYNPGDDRRRIVRIEVVRIRPQTRPGEEIGRLIEDPWKTLACTSEPVGCVAEFQDPDFVASGRDALYYVRAIQESTPAVNAAGLRCEPGETGPCEEVDPCYGDWRTPPDDDCLAPTEERAWSSPIYLEWSRPAVASRGAASGNAAQTAAMARRSSSPR